jgi:hypothetical protein
MDNKKEENKVLPFLKLGLTGIIAGRRYLGETVTVTPSTSSRSKYTTVAIASYGFDAGAGLLYKINDRIGFFGNAGYRFMYTGGNGQDYLAMTNHPFVNAGIRVLIKAKE